MRLVSFRIRDIVLYITCIRKEAIPTQVDKMAYTQQHCVSNTDIDVLTCWSVRLALSPAFGTGLV